MGVTLSEVRRAAKAHRAPLAGESAGYLVLALADQVLNAPRLVRAGNVQLSEDGALRVLSGSASSDEDAELSLRRALDDLLEVASSGSAALSRAGRRTEPLGLPALVRELEAALIPVNRAAARRALARLQRETARALASGSLPDEVLDEAEASLAPPVPRSEPSSPATALESARVELHREAKPREVAQVETLRLEETPIEQTRLEATQVEEILAEDVPVEETPIETVRLEVAPREAVRLEVAPPEAVRLEVASPEAVQLEVASPEAVQLEAVQLEGARESDLSGVLSALRTELLAPPELVESDALGDALEVRASRPPEVQLVPFTAAPAAELEIEIEFDDEPELLDSSAAPTVLRAIAAPPELTLEVCTKPEPVVLRKSLRSELPLELPTASDSGWPHTPTLGSLAAELPVLRPEQIAELSALAAAAAIERDLELAPSLAPEESTPHLPEAEPLSPAVALVASPKSELSELVASFQIRREPANESLSRAIKEMAELDLTPAPLADLSR